MEIFFLIILIFINSFFSMVESSIASANIKMLKIKAEDGDKRSSILLGYLENKQKLLASVRIYIYITLILGSIIVSNMFLSDIILMFEKTSLYKYKIPFSYSVFVIVYALISLLICELIPKRMGIKHSEGVLFALIKPMCFLCGVVSPFASLINFLANLVIRLFGIDPSEVDGEVTEEEIRMIIDAGGDNGSIDESEKEMINNIFEFDNTMVSEIFTHRTDIVAISIDAPMEEIVAILSNQKFSRIPVYEENIDNIIGVFHVKDVVKAFLSAKDNFRESFNLRDIIMTPYFVPFSKKTDELFEEMQIKKFHMAIVIDEYGGTAGLVTMEDLLEEIVGNIFDEYDDVEEEITADGDRFVIKGTTSLEEVEELFGVTFSDSDDYDTLGGYLIGRIGRIPEDGERPEVTVDSINFKVLEIEDKRIELVQVSN